MRKNDLKHEERPHLPDPERRGFPAGAVMIERKNKDSPPLCIGPTGEFRE